MRRPSWVSEEPEVHLLPHIEQAAAGCWRSRWSTRDHPPTAHSTFGFAGPNRDGASGRCAPAVFALVGSFAEVATYVRQRRIIATENGSETLCFEIVTGMLDDGMFAPHGHTVRIAVTL